MKRQSLLKEEFYLKGKVEDCPIYDLHGHMGPFYGIYFPYADILSMKRIMDKVGVKLLVFCHHYALFSPDIGNTANVEAVRGFPESFRVYLLINPNYPEIIERDLEAFSNYSDIYVGLKLLPDYHRVPISNIAYKSVWNFAEEKSLIVLVHTWGGSIYDGPEEVRKIAEKYHKVKILMGHSCHGEWDKAIRLVKDFPNIYLDLCAVLDDRGVLEKFVAELGSDRILFGTDFPWFSYYYYIGAVLGADITDEDRCNIFYRNAERLLQNGINR